jgi:hypothetical protein
MNRHCRLGARSDNDSNEPNITAPFQSCIVTGTGIAVAKRPQRVGMLELSPGQRLRRREFKKSEKHTTIGTTQSSFGPTRLSKKRSAA